MYPNDPNIFHPNFGKLGVYCSFSVSTSFELSIVHCTFDIVFCKIVKILYTIKEKR